jgi:hypothetical protein
VYVRTTLNPLAAIREKSCRDAADRERVPAEEKELAADAHGAQDRRCRRGRRRMGPLDCIKPRTLWRWLGSRHDDNNDDARPKAHPRLPINEMVPAVTDLRDQPSNEVHVPAASVASGHRRFQHDSYKSKRADAPSGTRAGHTGSDCETRQGTPA